MKKKIVHIVKGDFGGLDLMCARLFHHLNCYYDQEVLYFCRPGHSIYKNFNAKKVNAFQLGDEILFANLFKSISCLKSADIIHVHHTKFWILFSPLIFYRKKVVFTYHMSYGSGIKKNIFQKLLIASLLNILSLISFHQIFLTEGQRKELSRYVLFKKIFFDHSSVIGNFLDKKYMSLVPKKIDCLYVGRYSDLKGFRHLKNIALRNPDITFHFIGDNQFISKQKNIINHGLVKPSLVCGFYKKAKLFVLPSYTEAFPLTVLEAMSNSCAIVISDLPGMDELVVENYNGHLVQPGDEKALECCIQSSLKNKTSLKRMQRNSFKASKKYSPEESLKKHIAVYERVI